MIQDSSHRSSESAYYREVLFLLVAMNAMLWLTMRINLNMIDGGGNVDLYGFPIPWFRSTIMGTNGINVSIPLFLLDLALYFFIARALMMRLSITVKQLYALGFLCVAGLIPVLGSFVMAFVFDDWSSLIWWPWEGWDGEAVDIFLAHGLQPFMIGE